MLTNASNLLKVAGTTSNRIGVLKTREPHSHNEGSWQYFLTIMYNKNVEKQQKTMAINFFIIYEEGLMPNYEMQGMFFHLVLIYICIYQKGNTKTVLLYNEPSRIGAINRTKIV